MFLKFLNSTDLKYLQILKFKIIFALNVFSLANTLQKILHFTLQKILIVVHVTCTEKFFSLLLKLTGIHWNTLKVEKKIVLILFIYFENISIMILYFIYFYDKSSAFILGSYGQNWIISESLNLLKMEYFYFILHS